MKKATIIDGILSNDLWNFDLLRKKGFQVEKVMIPDGKGTMPEKTCVINETDRPITVLHAGYGHDDIILNPGEGTYVLERGNVEKATKYGFFTW